MLLMRWNQVILNLPIKAWVLLFMLAIPISGSAGMSISDAGKVCLFSKISGVIKLNGEPVSNARLVRTVNLSSPETDEASTDENGYFEMPAVFKRTIAKYLPQEFAVSQEIIVHYDGKEYRMWSGVKRKPEENSESRGKPLVVTCELNSEKSMIKVNNSPIFSLCTWDVEPDKPRKAF